MTNDLTAYAADLALSLPLLSDAQAAVVATLIRKSDAGRAQLTADRHAA